MLHFLQTNFVTIIVLAVLAAVIFLAVRRIVEDKKEGKSSCGCSCSHCPNYEFCHKKYPPV